MTLKEALVSGKRLRRSREVRFRTPGNPLFDITDVLSEDWQIEGSIKTFTEKELGMAIHLARNGATSDSSDDIAAEIFRKASGKY